MTVNVFNDSLINRQIVRYKSDIAKTNKCIVAAIQDITVLFFVRAKEISEANANANAVSFNTGKKDLLSYHFQQEYPISLRWHSPELVDSLLFYVPLKKLIAEVYKEFQLNIGIEKVIYEKDGVLKFITLRIHPEKCSGEFIFFLMGLFLIHCLVHFNGKQFHIIK